jgi:hypothetical protein
MLQESPSSYLEKPHEDSYASHLSISVRCADEEIISGIPVLSERKQRNNEDLFYGPSELFQILAT